MADDVRGIAIEELAEAATVDDSDIMIVQNAEKTQKVQVGTLSKKIEDNIGAITGSVDIPVKLLAANWSAQSPYSQTVQVAQMREGLTPIHFLADGASDDAVYAYSLITDYSVRIGQITFYASEKPAVDIDLVLKGVPAQIPEHEDTADDTVTFESGDADNPSAWAPVELIKSGETHKSLFAKLSTMVRNVRYLWKLMGDTDISGIGGGTVTGALSKLNADLGKGKLIFKFIKYEYDNPYTDPLDCVKAEWNGFPDDSVLILQLINGIEYIIITQKLSNTHGSILMISYAYSQIRYLTLSDSVWYNNNVPIT